MRQTVDRLLGLPEVHGTVPDAVLGLQGPGVNCISVYFWYQLQVAVCHVAPVCRVIANVIGTKLEPNRGWGAPRPRG